MVIQGIVYWTTSGVTTGDARTLEYSSYDIQGCTFWVGGHNRVGDDSQVAMAGNRYDR